MYSGTPSASLISAIDTTSLVFESSEGNIFIRCALISRKPPVPAAGGFG